MTNMEMSEGLLRQAIARRKMITIALEDGNFAYAVRLSQECVELALKALLIATGIDPPKWHDVGKVLRDNVAKLPSSVREMVNEISDASAKLRADRERSMYGDDALGLPPDRIYSESEAKRALAWSEMVLSTCRQGIGDLVR